MRKLCFALIASASLLAACAPLPPATHEAIADWKSGKADPDCEIAGHSSQWQADF